MQAPDICLQFDFGNFGAQQMSHGMYIIPVDKSCGGIGSVLPCVVGLGWSTPEQLNGYGEQMWPQRLKQLAYDH